MTGLRRVAHIAAEDQAVWRPVIFDRSDRSQAEAVDELVGTGRVWRTYDLLREQLLDLLRTRSPHKTLDERELAAGISSLVGETPLQQWGRWVYCPWSGRLVHVLPADEFTELRLDRNRYKIRADEQARLAQLTVGIV